MTHSGLRVSERWPRGTVHNPRPIPSTSLASSRSNALFHLLEISHSYTTLRMPHIFLPPVQLLSIAKFPLNPTAAPFSMPIFPRRSSPRGESESIPPAVAAESMSTRTCPHRAVVRCLIHEQARRCCACSDARPHARSYTTTTVGGEAIETFRWR